MGNLNINLDAIEDDSFSPIPEGMYRVEAKESELRTSRSGGTYLAVNFEVQDGKFIGRRIFQNFTITNANEDAQRIGKSMLKKFCTAFGKVGIVDDDTEILNHAVLAKVIITTGDEKYGPRNEIKGYYPVVDKKVVIEKAVQQGFDKDSIPF